MPIVMQDVYVTSFQNSASDGSGIPSSAGSGGSTGKVSWSELPPIKMEDGGAAGTETNVMPIEIREIPIRIDLPPEDTSAADGVWLRFEEATTPQAGEGKKVTIALCKTDSAAMPGGDGDDLLIGGQTGYDTAMADDGGAIFALQDGSVRFVAAGLNGSFDLV